MSGRTMLGEVSESRWSVFIALLRPLLVRRVEKQWNSTVTICRIEVFNINTACGRFVGIWQTGSEGLQYIRSGAAVNTDASGTRRSRR